MLWPLVLTAIGFAAALLPAVLRLPSLPTGVAEAIMVLGVAWSWWIASRRHGWRSLALSSLLSLVVAGHLVWLFSLSAYGDPPALETEEAPDLTAVRVGDGAAFHLAAQRGRSVVLVFFRGAW